MSIAEQIKDFIISEFVPDGETTEIADDLDLIQTGVLDSLAVLKTVAFIENEFDVALEPEEIDTDNFNTVNEIAALITQKRSSAATA